jgi:hypothetical protein
MLINQDFSVDRSKYIGGSDIGAILGLSRFRSPLEVWMEKTGKETKQLDSLPCALALLQRSLLLANMPARLALSSFMMNRSTSIHSIPL